MPLQIMIPMIVIQVIIKKLILKKEKEEILLIIMINIINYNNNNKYNKLYNKKVINEINILNNNFNELNCCLKNCIKKYTINDIINFRKECYSLKKIDKMIFIQFSILE